MGRRGRGARIAGVLAATWLVAGCGFLSPGGTTTEVTVGGPGGDRTIECRRETPVSGDACIAWGEQVIDELPTESADAARIVLTDGRGVGRCSADFQDADGAVYASAAVACP